MRILAVFESWELEFPSGSYEFSKSGTGLGLGTAGLGLVQGRFWHRKRGN